MGNNQRTVTRDGWGVSYTTGSDFEGVVLNVYKDYQIPNEFGGIGKFRHGDHDGKVFATRDEANDFALERGYLQIWTPGVACPKCRVVHRSKFGQYPRRESFCHVHGDFVERLS